MLSAGGRGGARQEERDRRRVGFAIQAGRPLHPPPPTSATFQRTGCLGSLEPEAGRKLGSRLDKRGGELSENQYREL